MSANNPLVATEAARYAGILRELLARLDREVILSALIGKCESDLLHTKREEVDGFRELTNDGIVVPFVLDSFRGSGLALLDAFEDELLSAHSHVAEPTQVG